MYNRYKFSGTSQYRRYIRAEKSYAIGGQNVSGVAPDMVHGTYKHLMFDPRWKAKRLQIIARDLNRCVVCGSSTDLQVHHRQYHFNTQTQAFKDPWDYPDHLMLTLCETCHKKGHNKFKVPIIKY